MLNLQKFKSFTLLVMAAAGGMGRELPTLLPVFS